MRATKGDRLHVHGRNVGSADETAEIIEVRGTDGQPPYLVRHDDGHEGMAGLPRHGRVRGAPRRRPLLSEAPGSRRGSPRGDQVPRRVSREPS